jgi:hypothetical protein
MFPKLCQDCKYSNPEKNSPWANVCTHPKVLMSDSWALSRNFEGAPPGSSCSEQRRRSGVFVPCGIKGKLWEQK